MNLNEKFDIKIYWIYNNKYNNNYLFNIKILYVLLLLIYIFKFYSNSVK